MTPKTWSLTSYTNSTITDLVVAGANGCVVGSVFITNIGVSSATISVYVTSSAGTVRGTILPGAALSAATPYVLDRQITLGPNEKLRVEANQAGVEFLAAGAE